MARYYVEVDGKEVGIEVLSREGRTVLRLLEDGAETPEVAADFAAIHSYVATGEGLYSLIADGKSYQVHVERTEDGLRLVIGSHLIDIRVLTEREWRLNKVAPRETRQTGAMTVRAPMPGLVKAVAVAAGDEVREGQRLIVLEAMKMENEIASPRAGRVAEVLVSEGSTVEGGKPLITLE